MRTVEAAGAETFPNPHGVHASLIYDTEHAQAVYMVLQPGESLKRHVTPVDVFFYVLEGEGTVEIGEERQRVGKDTLVDSPARIPHRWTNDGPGVLRLLVVKVPRQTENTRIL